MVTPPSNDDPAAQPVPDAVPRLLLASYRDIATLAALEAEFTQPMLRAVERSTGQTAVLATLERGAAPEQRATVYDQCTKAWPEHYGIPSVLDATSPDVETPYVVWSVETGDNLRAALQRGESLAQRRVLEIGRAVAETLAELHRFGERAEHLTPASIWLGPAGICQILGLGLGPPTRDLEGEGQRYRAPERLRRDATSMAERILAGDLAERADIWSLGVILLELLDGRPRLSARSADDLVREQLEVPWRPPGHLGHELASLLSSMLILDPVQRPVTADEVAAGLDDLLVEHQVTAPRGQARSRPATSVSSSDSGPDPPLPIPARIESPTDWRQTVRSVQERRRAFEAGDATPIWKIWLLPGVALAIVLLMLWLTWSLRPSP